MKESFHWYQLASNKGNEDSQNKLSIMYELGKGVEQDYDMAVYWLIKSIFKKKPNRRITERINNLYEIILSRICIKFEN